MQPLDPTPAGPAERTAAADERRSADRRQSTARTLLGTVIVITVLYTARQVFIPVALAALFAFLLTPVVRYLERSFLRRRGAVALVLTVTVALLLLSTWSLALQVNSLAREVAQYSGNLERKLEFLRRGSVGSFTVVERTLQRLSEKAEESVEKPDYKVRVLPERKVFTERWKRFAPTIEYVASAFLVVVLVYFLLLDRERLRDKLLRVAGRAHLTVTTQAIGETGHRISRFIFTQALLNIGFGTLIGIALFAMRVPHALLWGFLAAALRFVPYVGAILSAALPFMMAAAVFEGWYVPLGVLAVFVFVDQFLAGFIEPAVIGHRIGVSPIALLVTTIFWGWLWGPVGLLLATPITVCLTVAGEFIPALRIFSILFGTEAPLENYLSFYNRLLTRDRAGAAAMADRYSDENSMQEVFVDLFTPTLSFAAEELAQGRITRAHDHFIKDNIRELIVRIGDRNAHHDVTLPRLVAASVAGERLSLGTSMLTQLIRSDGWPVDYFTDLSGEEIIEYVDEVDAAALFLSCSSLNHLEQGVALVKQLRQEFPELPIIATGSAFTANSDVLLQAGASSSPVSLEEGLTEFGRLTRKRR